MPAFSSSQRNAIEALARDLENVFGPRLQALVAYGGTQGDGSVHSCALIQDLGFRDLVKCLPFTASWHQRRIAVPLMLSREELRRTLDIFPLEYAAIAADHLVVRGTDPFAGVTVPIEDLRRGIETQAKSHLIHLRESYLESQGETTRIAAVIAASAAPFRALLANLTRLSADGAQAAPPDLSDDALSASAARMGIDGNVVRDVLATSGGGASSVTDPGHVFAGYLEATQRIWQVVDRWRA